MENWKRIPEAPLYEISDRGRVRSNAGLKPKILKLKTKENGYFEIAIRVDGKQIWRLVHRLVAFAFLKPDPTRPTVNHKDGNKKNNRDTNLAWSTLIENNAHSAHKRVAVTNPKRAQKLTLAKVKQIRKAHAAGEISSSIAKRFGISPAMVRNIVYNRSWVMS